MTSEDDDDDARRPWPSELVPQSHRQIADAAPVDARLRITFRRSPHAGLARSRPPTGTHAAGVSRIGVGPGFNCLIASVVAFFSHFPGFGADGEEAAMALEVFGERMLV